MIGYEDICSQRQLTKSMKCKSDEGSVYAINKFDIIRILKRDENSVKTLFEMSENMDTSCKYSLRNAYQARNRLTHSLNISHRANSDLTSKQDSYKNDVNIQS